MSKTVEVVLELVYETGTGHRQISNDVDPVRMAKMDLKDVDWKRMCAKKVRVKTIKRLTIRESS